MKRYIVTGILTLSMLPSVAFAKFTLTEGKSNLEVSAEAVTSIEYDKLSDTAKTTSFRMNRGRLNLQGVIDENIVYRIRFRFEPVTTSASSAYSLIDYGYVGYSFSPALTLTLGKTDDNTGFIGRMSLLSPLTWSTLYMGLGSFKMPDGLVTTPLQSINYGLGARLGGKLFGLLEYWGAILNDEASSNLDVNQDRKYSTAFGVAVKSATPADVNGYAVDGDLKYAALFDVGLFNSKGISRKIIYPTVFASYQNAILQAGGGFELTDGQKANYLTFSGGYLIDKFFRPGVSYNINKIAEGDNKTFKSFAVNGTFFYKEGRLRHYVEFERESLPVSGLSAPYRLSTGLSLSI